MLHPTPTGSRRMETSKRGPPPRPPAGPLSGGTDCTLGLPNERRRSATHRHPVSELRPCPLLVLSKKKRATALAADIPRGFAACYLTHGFRRGAWRASRRVLRRYRSPMAPLGKRRRGVSRQFDGVASLTEISSVTRLEPGRFLPMSARSVDHQCRWFD